MSALPDGQLHGLGTPKTCLDSGRAPWRCFEHATSLKWLCSQGVAFHLDAQVEQVRGKHHMFVCIAAPLSHVFVFARISPFPSAVQHHHRSSRIALSTVCYDTASALALLCHSHGRCFCVYACVCVLRSMCERGVCCQRHTKRSRRAVDLLLRRMQPLSLTATKKRFTRYSSYSSSTAAVVKWQPRSKLSPSSQYSRCTCVWLVHSSRRSNHDNMNTSNATTETHRRTS